MRLKTSVILWGIIAATMIYSCAKIGSPTGGLKDSTPPQIKGTEPLNGSVNFNQKIFDIEFDEYVQLNNIQQNLIVSPPFSEKPQVKIKGKGIRVVLPEAPRENTTYSFMFFNAISDITERNEIASLVYAFSTGDQIDSLRVKGTVKDAFTTKPVEGIYVMLYAADNDTAFKTSIPEYLTVTDKLGDFEFQYVAEGQYQIYALEDANYSYSFDQPNEKIAFLDSLIIPKAERIFIESDSIYETVCFPGNLQLRLFEEKQNQQYIKEESRINPARIDIVFQQAEDSVITWSSPELPQDAVVTMFSEKNDSLKLLIQDEVYAKLDSISLYVNYFTHIDSIGWTQDTLLFPYPELENESLKIESNLKRGKLHYYRALQLESPALINRLDINKIAFYYQKNDSTEISQTFSIDTLKQGQALQISSKLLEGESYRVMFDSAAITDISGQTNDSLNFEFLYRKMSSYSSLKMNIDTINSTFFCELLSGENVIKAAKPNSENIVKFNFLEPGSYRVRLIMDGNNNDKWDTGNLEIERQPEHIIYYLEQIELRANWEQETDWILTE
ncbi:MAG: Ig-like domain-containing protein [Bacteroidota bacterium]|nr:Ig-like domain-containing protein [Bacteroidota bacterium]